MKRRMVRMMLACVAVASVPVAASSVASAVPVSYAPTGVTNLAGSAVNGQPRTVTLTFNAPSNAQDSTLSGYFIQYRCLTKATKAAPCTGKWRSVAMHEVEDDSTTNNELVTVTYTLPAGIAGTAGRPVSFRVIPVGDDDEMLLGPTSSASVINIRDTPVLVSTPVTTRSTGKQRITVTLAGTLLSQTRGSSSHVYTVEYSRNNKSWTSITAPTGGWGVNKSRIVNVPASGVKYYFRLKVASNAGNVTQDPPRSQVSR